MASFAPSPATASGQLPAAAAPAPAPAPARKKSKLPLVLGVLAVLFVLGIGVVGAAYWFVVRPMLDARRVVNEEPQPPREPTPIVENTPSDSAPKTTNTVKEVPPYVAPADAVQFVNSKDKLDGKLAEHYVDFSFYYPERWQKDPKAGVSGASNFAKVERRLPPDFTQENFAVGWYSSAGSEEGDRAVFPSLARNLSSQFAKGFSEYRKVSEGPGKAGPYDGYEFRFESVSRGTDKGDIKIWGRVIFLPPIDGGKNGVTLLMLATSLAPELKAVEDVGVKGDLPMMLESFRFGK
jgi:flagellar basal body-associated protein FliL